MSIISKKALCSKGDLAWVSDENKEYVFKEGAWIEFVVEEDA